MRVGAVCCVAVWAACAGSPPVSGFVSITSDDELGTSGVAEFFDDPITLLPEAFAVSSASDIIGPCVIYAGATRATPWDGNAGTITAAVDGTQLGFIAIPEDHDYITAGSLTGLWTDVTQLAITVVGGDVASFQRAVPTPEVGTLTTPTSPITAATTDDLALAWTGVSAASVDAFFDGIDPATNDEWSMGCSFDATLGSGVVPAAALHAIPWTAGALYVHATTTIMFSDGSTAITLQAGSHVAPGQLALQLD